MKLLTLLGRDRMRLALVDYSIRTSGKEPGMKNVNGKSSELAETAAAFQKELKTTRSCRLQNMPLVLLMRLSSSLRLIKSKEVISLSSFHHCCLRPFVHTSVLRFDFVFHTYSQL